MSIKRKFQKAVVKAKITMKINKAFSESSLDYVKDRMYMASAKMFDPYTGPAYQEMMEERLMIDKLRFKAYAISYGMINETVNQAFEMI